MPSSASSTVTTQPTSKAVAPQTTGLPALRAQWKDQDLKVQYDTFGYPGLIHENAENNDMDKRIWGWAQNELDLRAADIGQQLQRRRRGVDYVRVPTPPPLALQVMQQFHGMFDQYLAQEADRKPLLAESLPASEPLAAQLADLPVAGDASVARSQPEEPAKSFAQAVIATPKESGDYAVGTAATDSQDFTVVVSKQTAKAAAKTDIQLPKPTASVSPSHPPHVMEDFSRWFSLPQGKQPPAHLKYNCGVGKSGRLDYKEYGASPEMDLNLCAYAFSEEAHIVCPHGPAKCFWHHWAIENGLGQKETWVDQQWWGRVKGKKPLETPYPPDHFAVRTTFAGLPRIYCNGHVILPGGNIVRFDDAFMPAEQKQALAFQVAVP